LELNKDPDVVWRNKFNNKVRNAIRKSYKSNLEFVDCNLKEFYRIYTKNMKHLGTPSHSYSFFENLIKEFPRKALSSGVIHDGTTIASTFLLSFKDTLVSGWAASDKEYSMLNPNNFLYWEVIKFACNNGYRYFDFGRSLLNSGTFRFKKPWGGENVKLYYRYYARKKIPDTTQTNPKRQKFAKIWSKMPLVLTNIVGPPLRKTVP
jgi:lipid II:glycine glycyltransferase (peptidoglycan interpeptide bridge formation enzyme)